ncbi:hypothetical protein [Yinghuangia soli]|uniref:Uncharacterized protein n=1 Tax=Yinghuangia soli TaxID=2908204 RepID=A0AA41QBP1_9ACTN|nr:hypothetical protein [Yinghuangia soli]MCF2533832.1 hypothetical protein [Yinghuangia soli]
MTGVRQDAAGGWFHSVGVEDAADVSAAAVRDRVLRAREDLAEAAASRNGSAVREAVDELEDALAMARVNGVVVADPPTADAAPAGESDAERA